MLTCNLLSDLLVGLSSLDGDLGPDGETGSAGERYVDSDEFPFTCFVQFNKFRYYNAAIKRHNAKEEQRNKSCGFINWVLDNSNVKWRRRHVLWAVRS